MNLLSKTTPWVVASLLATTAVFGQDKCLPRPDKGQAPCVVKEMNPGMPGYSAPSGVNVCGSWDVNIATSFLYWRPSLENFDVAMTNKIGLANLATHKFGYNGDFIQMDYDFKPGFKIGVGMHFDDDNWEASAAYTRVHGEHKVSSTGPASPGLLFATVGNPAFLYEGQAFRKVSASYRCNLDFIDATIGRAFYVGKNVTARSVAGVRAAWILQNYAVKYNNPSTGGVAESSGSGPATVVKSMLGSTDVYSRTHSWGLGPQVGMETCWNLGEGVRFFNNGYLDVLHTEYKMKDRTHSDTHASDQSDDGNKNLNGFSRTKMNALRTHMNLELGFGWGSYFDNNNWHVDISAAYGFQVFFDQNMFRKYVGDIVVGNSIASNGNLYVQGLTATVNFDF